ncbi:hypothetical protein H072_81 [Dactylellina haptotyla CBS 200.50]|uniref:Fucose-specific lectin n=1 Tax=Dactylellina haptotyla (strain CBS 200.50) TaxID=1284197 RepID=S8CE42_DACHA|nr:hypothetical protein H072_81 [Dactylellina haptotyla CBS 200.50]
MRSWFLQSIAIVGCLVVGVTALALPGGIALEKRQLSSIPAGETAYPIKATIIGNGGNWIKFFFTTDNGKVYMGSWDRIYPYTTYTFEELLPAGSAKANSPLAATAWDLNTAVGSGVNWANANKRGRFYYADANGIIQERIYVGGGVGWSSGTIGSLGLTTLGSTGISAVSFFKDDVENVRLYSASASGALVEAGWGAYGVSTWSTYTVLGSASISNRSPISFANTKTWSTQPLMRGFYGSAGTIHDVAWNYTWSTGNLAQPLSDSTGSTNGGYSFAVGVWKVDAGDPNVNMFWCGDGASAGTLGTLYRAQYSTTTLTLGASSAIPFQKEPHSFVFVTSATAGSPPGDNHLFTWGNSTGTPAFWHYQLNGDSRQINLH